MKVIARFCRGCRADLTDANWYPSLKKSNTGYCKGCYGAKIPAMYCAGCGVLCSARRCEACDSDRQCLKCGAHLTDENWYPSFQERKLCRCKGCHDALVADWEKRHPTDGRQRTAR